MTQRQTRRPTVARIYVTTGLPDPNSPYRWREVTVWRNGHYRRYAVRLPIGRRLGLISMHSFERARRLQIAQMQGGADEIYGNLRKIDCSKPVHE